MEVPTTVQDFLFPKELWMTIYNFLGPALSTGYTMGSYLIVTYLVFVFCREWYRSYQVTGNAAMFPWGFAVLALILFIFILFCGWMFASPGGGFKLFGYNIVELSACDGSKEKDAGLCYDKCQADFHGVGPVCWANTFGIGAGTPVGLEPCKPGLTNIGLMCVGWDGCLHKWHTIFGDACIGGPVFQGRLDNGGVCPGPSDFGGDLGAFDGNYQRFKSSADKPDPTPQEKTDPVRSQLGKKTSSDMNVVKDKHTERVDGMCYKSCPSGMKHVPGMPYLCMKGDKLSYGRGAGTPPHLAKFLDRAQVWYFL